MKKIILLINLGTPATPTPKAIKKYLKKFLSDPRVVEFGNFPGARLCWLALLNFIILPIRSKIIYKNYEKIWINNKNNSSSDSDINSGSPLKIYTQSVANKLQEKLGPNYIIKYAMCYSQPDIPNTLNQLDLNNCEQLIILPLYPQYSCSTTAAVFDQITHYFKNARFVPEIKFINSYYQNAIYIKNIAKTITNYWQEFGRPEKLLFSFHGIPKAYADKGDPYPAQCEKTAVLIAQELKLEKHQWQLVYQSRFGKTPWLEPYCDGVLKNLPQQNIKNIHIISPGFSMDCLETLEEININYRKLFLSSGGESFAYIPALNNTDEQIELLTKLTCH